jgi:hypothetical protein
MFSVCLSIKIFLLINSLRIAIFLHDIDVFKSKTALFIILYADTFLIIEIFIIFNMNACRYISSYCIMIGVSEFIGLFLSN